MPDTFTCQYINRHDQFGYTYMDAIITHDQSVIPQARFSRKWKMAPNLIDADFMANDSLKLVDQVVAEWNDLQSEVI